MTGFRPVAATLLLFAASGPYLVAQPLRPGLSAGMGVTYRSAPDVVTLVNATPGASARIPDFNAGAEFFGSACFPLTETWVLKLDYSYQITSMNVETISETAQFTIYQHSPTLLLQYVLANEGVFNVKAGAGAGYYFGRLTKKFFYIDNSYSAHGPALHAELEGNTAFGEHLYACLGVSAGWSLVGRLQDGAGNSPGVNSSGEPATLNSFGVGARLGFTYYWN